MQDRLWPAQVCDSKGGASMRSMLTSRKIR